jgi:hypothetical protein
MSYSQFTLDLAHKVLGLTFQQATILRDVQPIAMSPWLQETLAKGMPLARASEKARSEFIVAPILLSVRELNQNRFHLYSGERFDVDVERGLIGECDFILATTPPSPLIQAPIMAIVEAKKQDILNGVGQCAAQMLGARIFNEREGNTLDAIWGCVTTGDDWQFMKLEAAVVLVENQLYYLNQVEEILGAFQVITSQYLAD